MTCPLVKVRDSWFFYNFHGHVTSKGYFHCFEKSCPNSVKLTFGVVDGKKTPLAVEKVICDQHCHCFPGRDKAVNRKMIEQEKALIESGNDEGDAIATKHKEWQKIARKKGKKLKKLLTHKATTIDYACQRPHLSCRQVEENSTHKMSACAIGMARLRQMKKDGDVTNLDDLIAKRNHHLLTNDGDEILVFGLKSAVRLMATTKMILADGTFKCVLPGFSQLYILHAVVENNVSLPMLFCLLKRKDGETYTRLLRLVEELAVRQKTNIFDRPVTLMCDFEKAFIDAVKDNYGSVAIKCCFFHFSKNVRTNATPVMTAIRRAAGKTSKAYRLALKIKRLLRMLPLLPEELITPEVIGLIHRLWQQGCPEHGDAFDGLIATILRTYVGTPPGHAPPTRPRFPRHLWSVSGMCIRTKKRS